jgi:hypothetical protein
MVDRGEGAIAWSRPFGLTSLDPIDLTPTRTTTHRAAALRARLGMMEQAIAHMRSQPFFQQLDQQLPGAAIYLGGQ